MPHCIILLPNFYKLVNNKLAFKMISLWYFVTAALENWYKESLVQKIPIIKRLTRDKRCQNCWHHRRLLASVFKIVLRNTETKRSLRRTWEYFWKLFIFKAQVKSNLSPRLFFKIIYLKEGIRFAFINNNCGKVTNLNSRPTLVQLFSVNESFVNAILKSQQEKQCYALGWQAQLVF